MKFKHENNLDGLINCLQEIRNKTTDGSIPICVCVNNRNIALRSICLETSPRGEKIVCLESDLEDGQESSTHFVYYEI